MLKTCLRQSFLRLGELKMVKKLILILFVVLLFVLAGCAENRDVEVTIKGHEVKTVIIDGKPQEKYYIIVIGDDFKAEVEVYPKTGLFVGTFEQQFPLEKIIIVKEKELLNIQGEVK